jgi:hypothetical protein
VPAPKVKDHRPAHHAGRAVDLAVATVPVAAAVLWVAGFRHADVRAMTDLGLVSLFTPAVVASLLLLTAGFMLALYRRAPEWLPALHVLTYLALVHATPAVLYGTLRYNYSYKHVGIVDYILRHGQVDTTIDVLGIYHNWPGFFSAGALLTALGGSGDALTIASWAPLVFNVLNLLALRFMFRGLTRNRRLVWLAIWFFFVITWVGQDYFSPQATVFVLYLTCVGLLLRGRLGTRRLVLFTLLAATIAASHQITPVMLATAVTALVMLRRARGWYLPVISVAVVLGWMLLVARGYTVQHAEELIETFGEPVTNAHETLNNAAALSPLQRIVSWGGRAVVVAAAAVALAGVWRSWRHRRLQLEAAILMAAPAVLVFVTGFGGEVLFRAFLFAAPFISYLAAYAVLAHAGPRRRGLRVVMAGALTVALLPGFLLGYYGKERQNYFPPTEIQAVRWVHEHAPPGSLLIEGNRNYPAMFRNYENFVYVPIGREPQDGQDEILGDPVGVLGRWMGDERFPGAYVLLTRSQKIEVEAVDPMPTGTLERIEAALARSPEFRVALDTGDAIVFVLADKNGSAG